MKSQKSKLKIKKLLLFSFLIVIFHFSFLFFNLRNTYAQSLGLTISPPIFEVMIKPGKSVSQTFKITNDGDPVILAATLGELTESGIKNNPDFVPEIWLTTRNSEVELDRPLLIKTHETRKMTLLINPGIGTTEGDYYRVLYFTTKPNPIADTSQASIAQNIGSPILITVTNTGFVDKSAKIKSFTVPLIFDSFDNLNTRIDVENSGKTYFRPVGNINLDGPLGHAVFNIIPQVILAGQTKTISAENSYQTLSKKLTLSLPGFFIGKYTLKTDFTLDESKIRLTQTKTTYAFPWKISTGIILGIFLFSYFVKRKKQIKTPIHDQT